jgi:nucleoid-associated protein YgaU
LAGSSGSEVELATRTERRNIVLTFAAATVTVVAVIAVLAGPAALDCAGSPDGMATCLRDKVSDFGLLPGRETAVTAEAPDEPGTAPEAEVALGVPELTLLRAQPDGSVVVAGTAGAGRRVAVYANGELLGTATAEPSGDWALVPDAPLPPGGSEIAIREAEGGAAGTRSFVVVIDPEKRAQPMVVATTPDEAQRLLRELATPAAEAVEPAVTEPEVTPEPAAETQPEPAGVPVEPLAEAPSPEDVFVVVAEVPRPLRLSVALAAAAGAQSTAVGTPEMPLPSIAVVVPDPFDTVPEVPRLLRVSVALAAATGTQAAAAAVLEVRETPIAVAALDPFGIVPEVPRRLEVGIDVFALPGARDTLTAGLALRLPEAPLPGTDPFTVVPDIAPPPLLPDMAVVDPGPTAAAPGALTLEAIEIDGGMAYFAGAGEEGGTVRLFIDDRLVGESEVEEGRWLVEAADALAEPSQRVRVEMVLEGRKAVAVATEVEVLVDLPDVAAGPHEAASVAPEVPAFAAVPGAAAVGDQQEARIEIAAASVDGAAGIVAEAPPLEIGALPPAKSGGGPGAKTEPAPRLVIAEAIVDGSAGLAAEPARFDVAALPPPPEPRPDEPTPPPSPSVEVLEAPAMTPSVVELDKTENAAVPDPQGGVQTIRATPLRDLGPMRFSSGKVIIRRGDTLWDIAHRVYGDGYKYRTIYRANRDKIRRPGRIYPGQVFDIPLVFDDR